MLDIREHSEYEDVVRSSAVRPPQQFEEAQVTLGEAHEGDEPFERARTLREVGGAVITIPEDRGEAADRPETPANPIVGAESGDDPEPPNTSGGTGTGRPPTPPPPGDSGFAPDPGDEGSDGSSETPSARFPRSALSETVDKIEAPGRIVLVNTAHADRPKAEAMAAQFVGGDAPPWQPAESLVGRDRQVERLTNRRYYTDSQTDPTVLIKKSTYETVDDLEVRDAVSEMMRSHAVASVISSDAVQEVARAHGFAGIDVVEPLAVADLTGELTQTVAYPWQPGHLAEEMFGSDESQAAALSSEVSRVTAVTETAQDHLRAHGIDALDLTSTNILVDSSNRLHVIDAEFYADVDPGEATLEPGEVRSYQGETMQDESGIHHAEAGVAIAARSGNVGENPILNGDSSNSWVVTFSNVFTGESALMSINATEAVSARATEMIDEIVTDVSSLGSNAVVAHIIGTVESGLIDGEPVEDWRDQVKEYLASWGAGGVRLCINDQGKKVQLDVATGRVQVFDADGQQLYDYSPVLPESSQ